MPPTDSFVKQRAPRNRTLDVTGKERQKLKRRLRLLTNPVDAENILDSTVCQDVFVALPHLPDAFVDLLFVDPPYNLHESFNGRRFKNVRERWEKHPG